MELTLVPTSQTTADIYEVVSEMMPANPDPFIAAAETGGWHAQRTKDNLVKYQAKCDTVIGTSHDVWCRAQKHGTPRNPIPEITLMWAAERALKSDHMFRDSQLLDYTAELRTFSPDVAGICHCGFLALSRPYKAPDSEIIEWVAMCPRWPPMCYGRNCPFFEGGTEEQCLSTCKSLQKYRGTIIFPCNYTQKGLQSSAHYQSCIVGPPPERNRLIFYFVVFRGTCTVATNDRTLCTQRGLKFMCDLFLEQDHPRTYYNITEISEIQWTVLSLSALSLRALQKATKVDMCRPDTWHIKMEGLDMSRDEWAAPKAVRAMRYMLENKQVLMFSTFDRQQWLSFESVGDGKRQRIL